LRKLSALVLVLLLFAASFNLFTMNGIRPMYVKGANEDPSQFIFEKWNSFSRVVVFNETQGNPNWFSSPAAPADSTCTYYWILIDGDAGTAILEQKEPGDLYILRYDITNIAYYLREGGESACIMGVGGGKDIHSALMFGIKNVVGVEVNPIFIDLQKNKFRKVSNLADRPNVKLVVDEARSYLSRSDQKFSLIQMALTDTWASTGAGAFTLTENSLYTLEAWKIILAHLDSAGIFTVSRWYSPNNLGETGRIVSLAVSSLLHSGVPEPSRHIAMMSIGRMATLIVSKRPFTETEITTLKNLSQNLKFEPVIIPGILPANDILREIVSVKSDEELVNVIKDKPLNYFPPTDNNPYFFNMLKLSHLGEVSTSEYGVLFGNLTASITLLVLIISLSVLTAITIIFPLIKRPAVQHQNSIVKSNKIFWKGAVYFSLIGAGFMMIEIGLIQRLSVFLGHPAYALGILLFTIILSAGTGSYFSEKIFVVSGKWKYILPAITALMIIAVKFILDIIMASMVASPELNKIVVSFVVIFPLGFMMGTFFPMGMKIVKSGSEAETPWFWALNGIFGVLFSALAIFFSIYTGISTNFYLASLCYASIPLLIRSMYKSSAQIFQS
ncbi:MAG TPA: hypothetical protein VJ455_08800, partial [Ignavibacteria bacterium]|nr:hypothetical protein [Ignavibacteria bacterium]